jgi:hypothetical protein
MSFNSSPPPSTRLRKQSRATNWRTYLINAEVPVRFQVLTAANVKTTDFLYIAPCGLVEVGRRFRGACCLHHEGDPDEGSTHLWNVCSSSRLHGAIYQKAVSLIFTGLVLLQVLKFCVITCLYSKVFALVFMTSISHPEYGHVWRLTGVLSCNVPKVGSFNLFLFLLLHCNLCFIFKHVLFPQHYLLWYARISYLLREVAWCDRWPHKESKSDLISSAVCMHDLWSFVWRKKKFCNVLLWCWII